MMELKAYAKLNLFLDIVGRREDGYHLLKMIMQSVDLYDTVKIVPSEKLEVSCGEIDEKSNSAYKAAKLFFLKTGLKEQAKIIIEKHIPVEAGLGGGSADAAAALYGLNLLFDNPLSYEELLLMSIQIGADVPFSLTGGTCAAGGIGEKLLPVNNSLNAAYLIAKPKGGCSTPQIFKMYDKHPNNSIDGAYNRALYAVKTGDIKTFCENAFNALTPYACELLNDIHYILNKMKNTNGIKAAFMTGSGSACVGIFEDKKSALLAAEELKKLPQTDFAGVYFAVRCGLEII